MIWNPEMETVPRGELEAAQLHRLQQTAHRVYERVAFYRRLFDSAGVHPGQIRVLDDIRRLPLTHKTDFRDTYPFGLFAVPLTDVARIHASSGTTGKPIVAGYTANDIRTWAELCARCLASAGAQKGDVFQNAYGYGLFTGGLGFHYGGELMGLVVVPVSGGNTERQITLLRDFGTRILTCTPSYALTLAEALQARGIDPGQLKLRCGILGAEPWTEAMRAEIEQKLGIDAVNIYGLTEIIGPGVSVECVEEKNGMHVFEDHFLVEVIDPQTGDPVPEGQFGELVFTTLSKEALPVIRYRTGDIASVTSAPCRCGRTLARMSRVVGRTDDMLIIRGINVYPSQVESVLVAVPELSPHYQLVVTRERILDDLEVRIEVGEGVAKQLGGTFSSDEPMLAELAARCQQKMLGVLGITAKLTLVPPGSLPRSEGGKLKRVIDQRTVYA
ncbi:MAG: phenylacetate--CoA ligase family protein [bacterium]